MRILAIDPGFDRAGVAVLEGDASRPTLLWSMCVTPAKGPASERLAEVLREVTRALQAYAPDALAIETVYFSVNKKSAIGVAEARGMILALAGSVSLPVIECAPGEVKLAVTGYGAATKAAVARMLPHLLVLPKKKWLDDELDAVAIGVCALSKGRKVVA